jgi:hypothetical protein
MLDLRRSPIHHAARRSGSRVASRRKGLQIAVSVNAGARLEIPVLDFLFRNEPTNYGVLIHDTCEQLITTRSFSVRNV